MVHVANARIREKRHLRKEKIAHDGVWDSLVSISPFYVTEKGGDGVPMAPLGVTMGIFS